MAKLIVLERKVSEVLAAAWWWKITAENKIVVGCLCSRSAAAGGVGTCNTRTAESRLQSVATYAESQAAPEDKFHTKHDAMSTPLLILYGSQTGNAQVWPFISCTYNFDVCGSCCLTISN